MADAEGTRWTIIRGAAAGQSIDRREFALRYEPLIRAYLGHRWRGGRLLDRVDDAVQDVFVRFFAEDGLLRKVEPGWPGGFRAYLYGVVRNVARDFEKKLVRNRERDGSSKLDLDRFDAEEESLARVFDREWAFAAMRQAALLQEERAREQDERAWRRVELLRLRFEDDLPIRDIAAQWNVPAAHLHREYARAREEFKDALRDVMRVHEHESREKLDEECRRLLEYLA